MSQKEIFELCMRVIGAPDVKLAFSRMYLYSSMFNQKVELTIRGDFVVEALELGKNVDSATLGDKNYIEAVRRAYDQTKDALTTSAANTFICYHRIS